MVTPLLSVDIPDFGGLGVVVLINTTRKGQKFVQRTRCSCPNKFYEEGTKICSTGTRRSRKEEVQGSRICLEGVGVKKTSGCERENITNNLLTLDCYVLSLSWFRA